MAYVKGQPFVPQFTDPATGLLMASGTVEFYLTGTSTPTAYYTDSAGTSGGTSLTLDSGGKPSTDIYFDTSITYKIVVKDAAGSTIDTIDPFSVGIDYAQIPNNTATIATVAAIQAADLTGVSAVQTLGYTTAGDGGGALYRADTGDTSTADDGFLCIVSNDGVRFKLVITGAIRVKWCGATGDGVTDDTAALTKFVAEVDTNGHPVIFDQGTYLVDGGILFFENVPSITSENAVIKRNSLGSDGSHLVRVRSTCTFYGVLEIDGNKSAFSPGSTDRNRVGLLLRDANYFINKGVIISHDNVGHGFLLAQTHHNDLGQIASYSNGVNSTPYNDDGIAYTTVTYTKVRGALLHDNTRYGASCTGGVSNSYENVFENIYTYNNTDGAVDFEATGSCVLKHSQLGDATNGWEAILCTHSEGVYVEDVDCSVISGGTSGQETDYFTGKSLRLHPPTGNSNISLYGDSITLRDVMIYNSGLSFSSKTISVECPDGNAVMDNVWCEHSRIYEVIGARHITGCGADAFESGTVYQINGLSLANTAGDSLIEVRNGKNVSIEPEQYTYSTFADLDTSPSVKGGRAFETYTNAITINDFDNGYAGQEITVISRAAVTYDTTGTNLTGSSVDIVTAAGDATRWYCTDGTTWVLLAYVDVSADNSAGA